MTGIPVTIDGLSQKGELRPRYDEESQILAAESPVDAEWTLGLDIDGNLVFDLAQDRTLMNFDLHIGKRRWKEDPSLEWPRARRRGSLVFEPEAVTQKSFHLPLAVRHNSSLGIVRVDFGEAVEGDALELSDRCLALLNEGTLAGFVLHID